MNKNTPKKDYFFCLFFFLSFFYELPLLQVSFDRVNPRIFDVVFIWGVLGYYKYIFKRGEPKVLRIWRYLIIVFSLCAIYWSLFLPFNITLFSWLAVLRYWQSYVLIKIIINLKPDLDFVCKVSFLGLCFVSIWCFFEYQNPITKDGLYEVTPGNFVLVPPNAIFGPLSPNYFHIGQLLPLATMLSLAYALKINNLYLIFFSIILSWPVLFVGSRTSLGLFVISVLIFFWLNRRKVRVFAVSFIVFIILIFAGGVIYDSLLDNSLTFQRMVNLEKENRNTVEDRFDIGDKFLENNYDASLAERLLVGTGFNVSPVSGGRYRIGYGIHSLYLYPLEQGGVLAFLLFFIFLFVVFRNLKSRNIYTAAVFSYFIAMLLVGFGAHNFWREFGSGNVNTYIIVCIILCSLLENRSKHKLVKQYENPIN